MGLDNSKWVEIDKRQCIIDIIDGKIDLFEDDVMIVGFQDEGYTQLLSDTIMSDVEFLVSNNDTKFFKKVIDIDK